MGVLIMSLNQMPELNGLVFLSGAPHSCKQDSHTFVYLDYSVSYMDSQVVFFDLDICCWSTAVPPLAVFTQRFTRRTGCLL